MIFCSMFQSWIQESNTRCLSVSIVHWTEVTIMYILYFITIAELWNLPVRGYLQHLTQPYAFIYTMCISFKTIFLKNSDESLQNIFPLNKSGYDMVMNREMCSIISLVILHFCHQQNLFLIELNRYFLEFLFTSITTRVSALKVCKAAVLQLYSD